MKNVLLVSILVSFTATALFGQIAQGPATGTIPSGVSVSTNNFGPLGPTGYPGPVVKKTHNKVRVFPLPMPENVTPPTGPEGSNLIPALDSPLSMDGIPPVTIASFGGIPQTNSIPPDPHFAVGPNHIMQVVNSSFRIADKSGTTLKTINADSWFSSALPGVGSFDPKVVYDHWNSRWVMVWLDQTDATQTSYFLVSVSDDSDPLGTWYNWAIPSNTNGGTVTSPPTWTDYQGVGFDSVAFYFTGNTFAYSPATGYYGVKVRILPKAQFYANNAGPVTWTDFWSLRDLSGFDVFTTRPVVMQTSSNAFYLVGKPNFTGGSYFALYRITNALGTPSISCVHVPVTSWTNAPNANQLGGGSLAIETGSSAIQNEPTFSNGSVYLVHSVANGAYSAVRYVRINTVTNLATEDVAFGDQGFWHFYTALAVDQNNNLAITFSRSGDTEYIGAFFTWRLNSDPPGLRETEIMREGQANYVKDFGSGRNRWGDYNGIWVDPADQSNFWMYTEYVSAPNTWATWVHGMRLVPYSGSRISASTASINFGNIEAGTSSDSVTVTIRNIGSDPLTVSSIVKTQSAYSFHSLPTLPTVVATFDSIRFRVRFNPTVHGIVNDTITISSSDLNNPTTRIVLQGKGVVVGQAAAGVMYAVTGPPAAGQLYTINTTTGAATAVGLTGIAELDGLAIRPTTRELYGIHTTILGSTLYRVSSQYGDVLVSRTIGIPNLRAIAFSAGDTLYGATTTGRLFRINVNTGSIDSIGTAAGKAFSGISFSPTSGKLWGSVRPPITGRDSIHTINTQTGQTTTIGRTGLGLITPYIAFDPTGKLYALIGTGSQTNTLYNLDTLTATATQIGSTGVTGLYAIAMRTDSLVTGVDDEHNATVPGVYTLQQNYPNPFNPATEIRYGLPHQSNVRLVIYNLVGQEVTRLFNGVQSAGYHSVSWNGTNAKGSPVASGIYFYSIEAKGLEQGASVFKDSRKMLLVK